MSDRIKNKTRKLRNYLNQMLVKLSWFLTYLLTEQTEKYQKSIKNSPVG